MSYCGESSMFWSPLQSRACLIDGSFSAGFTRMGGRCWQIHWNSSSVSIVTHVSVIGHIHIRFSVSKEPSTEDLDAIVNLSLRSRVVVFIPSSVFTNIVINQSSPDGGWQQQYSLSCPSKTWSEDIRRWKWGTRVRIFWVTISIYFLQQMHQQQYLHVHLLHIASSATFDQSDGKSFHSWLWLDKKHCIFMQCKRCIYMIYNYRWPSFAAHDCLCLPYHLSKFLGHTLST